MDSLIGPVPTGWRHQRLDDYCQLQHGPGGSALKSADKVIGGVPVVNATDVDGGRIKPAPAVSVSAEKAERLDRYRLEPGDILLVRIRATTRHAMVGEANARWLMGGSCIRIRVATESRENLLPAYLDCYLRHPSVKEWLAQQTLLSVVPTVKVAALAALPLVLPPIDVQAAVVDIVRAFDEKIQIHNNIVGTTRALRDLLLPQLLSGECASTSNTPTVQPARQDSAV